MSPHFLCWILGVVQLNTWLISSWEENICCYKMSKCTKWLLLHSKWSKVSFWVKIVVIFFRCSACNNSYLISQLEIIHVLNGTSPEIQQRKWGLQEVPNVQQTFSQFQTQADQLHLHQFVVQTLENTVSNIYPVSST